MNEQWQRSVPSVSYLVLLIGPPGVGKGTLARGLMQKMHFHRAPCVHVSTGDLLRQLPPDHPRAAELQSLVARGQFVSDETMQQLLIERLRQQDAANVCLLDGFPRTKMQAIWCADELRPRLVVVLDAPREELIRRISGRRIHLASGRTYNVNHPKFAPRQEGMDDETGEPLIQRSEDAENRVTTRLDLYDEETMPAVRYLEERFRVYGSPLLIRTHDQRDSRKQIEDVFPWIKHRICPA